MKANTPYAVAGILAIAAARTTVQLLLIGHVLKLLFAHVHIVYMALISLVMLAAAGREVMARQHRSLRQCGV